MDRAYYTELRERKFSPKLALQIARLGHRVRPAERVEPEDRWRPFSAIGLPTGEALS